MELWRLLIIVINFQVLKQVKTNIQTNTKLRIVTDWSLMDQKYSKRFKGHFRNYAQSQAET